MLQNLSRKLLSSQKVQQNPPDNKSLDYPAAYQQKHKDWVIGMP